MAPKWSSSEDKNVYQEMLAHIEDDLPLLRIATNYARRSGRSPQSIVHRWNHILLPKIGQVRHLTDEEKRKLVQRFPSAVRRGRTVRRRRPIGLSRPRANQPRVANLANDSDGSGDELDESRGNSEEPQRGVNAREYSPPSPQYQPRENGDELDESRGNSEESHRGSNVRQYSPPSPQYQPEENGDELGESRGNSEESHRGSNVRQYSPPSPQYQPEENGDELGESRGNSEESHRVRQYSPPSPQYHPGLDRADIRVELLTALRSAIEAHGDPSLRSQRNRIQDALYDYARGPNIPLSARTVANISNVVLNTLALVDDYESRLQ